MQLKILGYVDICFSTEMATIDQEVLQYISPVFVTDGPGTCVPEQVVFQVCELQ